MSKTTIKLNTPIEAHGNTVSELTLRAPKAKELRDLPIKQNMTMGDLYGIAAACADVPPSSIDQLDAADIMKVMEVVGGFLGLGTGETQSS